MLSDSSQTRNAYCDHVDQSSNCEQSINISLNSLICVIYKIMGSGVTERRVLHLGSVVHTWTTFMQHCLSTWSNIIYQSMCFNIAEGQININEHDIDIASPETHNLKVVVNKWELTNFLITTIQLSYRSGNKHSPSKTYTNSITINFMQNVRVTSFYDRNLLFSFSYSVVFALVRIFTRSLGVQPSCW